LVENILISGDGINEKHRGAHILSSPRRNKNNLGKTKNEYFN